MSLSLLWELLCWTHAKALQLLLLLLLLKHVAAPAAVLLKLCHCAAIHHGLTKRHRKITGSATALSPEATSRTPDECSSVAQSHWQWLHSCY